MRARHGALALALALLPAQMPVHAREEIRTLHQERSLYRNISVLEKGGQRCMVFSRHDGRQGCMTVADPDEIALPYARAFLSGLLLQPSPRRVLVIGLGIGTMPMVLRRYDPSIQVDVVELDPAVEDVARAYFGFRCEAGCRVHIGDGRMFVRAQGRAGRRYDLIMVDAFDVKYIPEHLLTREFMQQLRAILAPDGIVAANTFSNRALQPYEVATYQSVFGTTLAVETSAGNRIILAARGRPPTLAAMRANAARIGARLQGLGVPPGWLLANTRPQPPATGYEPLTDQYSPSNLLLSY